MAGPLTGASGPGRGKRHFRVVLAREKVVAAASDRFLVVVDETKESSELNRPVPIEVLPDALASVSRDIEALGGDPTVRDGSGKDGPVVTDNGNFMADCDFGPIADPGALASQLSSIPGLIEHGLFVGMADAVYVGTDEDVAIERY